MAVVTSNSSPFPTLPFSPVQYDPDIFVEKVDEDLICSICSCVVSMPNDLACGHLFCNDCLEKWRVESKTCPICRQIIPPPSECKLNVFITKKVWRMTVKCRNYKMGCTKTMALGEKGINIHNHLAECLFESAICSDCKAVVLRKELDDHKIKCVERLIRCDGCGICYKSLELKEHQDTPLQCKLLMTCPNECKVGDRLAVFKIGDLESHLHLCPLEKIKCELCSELVERYNLDHHQSQVLPTHFAGLRSQNKELKSLLFFVQKELLFLKSTVATMKNTPIQPSIGLKVDIRDAVGKWCAAQVVDVTSSDATIHFEGWDSKWDEGVDFVSEPYRFARQGEIPRVGRNPYRLGQQVRARYLLNGASGQYRMEGTITALDGVELQVNSRRWYHVLEVEATHTHAVTTNSGLTGLPDSKRKEAETKDDNKVKEKPSVSQIPPPVVPSSSPITQIPQVQVQVQSPLHQSIPGQSLSSLSSLSNRQDNGIIINNFGTSLNDENLNRLGSSSSIDAVLGN